MIIKNPYPEIEIPELPLNEYVLARADVLGDKLAFIDSATDRSLSYRELANQVRAVAAGLAERGFHKGEVFAIYCPNCPEYAVAFHGVAYVGGVITTINSLFTGEELLWQLRDTGARYLLTTGPLLDRALAAAGEVGLEEVFVIGEAEGATPFDDLLNDAGEPPTVSIDSQRDPVALLYSSGTTGRPKGVMLSHHNLIANTCQWTELSIMSGDTVAVLPFSHIFGLVTFLCYQLRSGEAVVTLPRFELETFLRIIQDYRIEFVHLVPPILVALAKHPIVDDFDLTSLRLIFSGAAPLGAETELNCIERLGVSIKQGYGMTELSCSAACMPGAVDMPGSVGRPLPNTECKVIDPETGNVLGPGHAGELCVRGPQVMLGYLNHLDATREIIDADGWLHTGDLAEYDRDGFIYIRDRLKELIKYKGYQVAPAELEEVLLSHFQVADAAVIGIPDEAVGELPKGFVVLKPDESEDAGAILDFVAERVAPYKKLRALAFVEQIPRASSGKILRRLLRDEQWQVT